MDNELSRNKNRTLPHFQDRGIVESNDNEIKFAKLTRESNTAYRSINTKAITSLHQPLWFWQKHSQWSYFKKGLFWGGIISCTAIFSAGCGAALTRINLVEKAIQRGLARQSVAEVPSVETKDLSACTVEGGGLPHERHRGCRLKVPSGRWRGAYKGQTQVLPTAPCEYAVQQRLKPHVAISQRIEIYSNTRSSHQAVLNHSIDLLLIEVEPDTNSMVKFSSTSIGKTKAILVLQFDPHNRVAKTINIPTDSRVKIPGFGWGTIADAYEYGGIPLVSQVLTQSIDGVSINRYVRATAEVFQRLTASGELTLNNCDSRTADCSNKVEQIIRQEDTFKAIHQHLNIPADLANFQATVTDIKPRLDTDLSLPELMSIANFVKDLNPENITTSLLPEYVPGEAVTADNRSNPSKSIKAQSISTTATNTTESLPSLVLNVTIAVQNTTDSPELGMKVVNYLRQQHFKNVYLVEHIPLKLKQTQIVVNHSHFKTANYVKNVLDFGRLKPNPKSEQQELTLKIGEDAHNLSVNN